MTTGKITPDDKTGSDSEPFLSRWSRRKEKARRESPDPLPQKGADAEAPAPPLPRLDQLTFESDFRGFLHPKVSEDMRRAALKKLFSDPRFNVMDGLDVYIDDYSKSDPIPAAMLAGLRQAQQIIERAKEEQAERAALQAQQTASTLPPERPVAVTRQQTEEMSRPEDAGSTELPGNADAGIKS
ncbi:MAG TPA: DUF3306 domain-containing protein [Burkholderiales bacterium]|nr:DUF3306 domain-containing protein [Burkholderiales bacterium]